MQDDAPAQGSQQTWAIVATVPTPSEAELLAGFLENQGVTVEQESRLFTQEPVSLGTMGDVRIRVPMEQAAEARRLLAELAENPPPALDEAGDDPTG